MGLNRAVARGDNGRIARPGVPVDHYAAFALEVQLPRQLGAGHHADAHDHKVRGNPGAVRQLDRLHAIVLACQARHPGAEADLDTAAGVRGSVELRYHRRNRTADQAVSGFDDGHRLSLRASDGRGLKSDEPAADHHHRLGVRLESRRSSRHRRCAGTSRRPGRHRAPQPARAGTDGQRQPVEGQHLATLCARRSWRTPRYSCDRLDPFARDKRNIAARSRTSGARSHNCSSSALP